MVFGLGASVRRDASMYRDRVDRKSSLSLRLGKDGYAWGAVMFPRSRAAAKARGSGQDYPIVTKFSSVGGGSVLSNDPMSSAVIFRDTGYNRGTFRVVVRSGGSYGEVIRSTRGSVMRSGTMADVFGLMSGQSLLKSFE